MVMLTVSAAARPGKRHELLDTFRQIVEKTRPEKGCHECRLSQDIDHENLIYLEEEWQDRSRLDEYFRSDIFGALLGAVKLLGKAHDIRINDGSTAEGLEAVQSARSI